MKWVCVAVLLYGWSLTKAYWEGGILNRQMEFRKGPAPQMTLELRDALGQGATLAVLSGFRGVVANFVWLEVTKAWQDRLYSRLKSNVELAVLLQPRFSFYWEQGGWHVGFNASAHALEDDAGEPNPARRQRNARAWIHAGEELFLRGIQAVPEKPQLYINLGQLYYLKLQDFDKAAEFYERASRLPDAPAYAERFPGFVYRDAAKFEKTEEGKRVWREKEYGYWKNLWNRYDDHSESIHRWGIIKERIRLLEEDLSIRQDERLFRKS